MKPIDTAIVKGWSASHRAVTRVNAEVAPKVQAPEAESATEGRRQHGVAQTG